MTSRKRSFPRRTRRQKLANRTFLNTEALENRILLAGDTWHNVDMPMDTNGDQRITPRDYLIVFNEINDGGSRELTEDNPPAGMVDVNNDGYLTPKDGLPIIKHLNEGSGEGDAFIQLRLSVTSRDDLAAVSTLDVNEDFYLRVFATDLTDEAAGVFTAYLDVEYDQALADADGTIDFSDDFRDGTSGNVSVDGLLDEVGGLNQRQPTDGAAEILVLSIPMRTENTPGELNFAGNAADIQPLHEVLLFRDTNPILPEEIMFLDTSVLIRGDQPTAINDQYNGVEDTQLSRTAAEGVLSNDLPGGLTAFVVSNPTDGTLNLNADGSFTYQPNANFTGTDSFTYQATDGAANSNVATVQLSIAPVNDTPVARNDGYETDEGVQLEVSAANGLLANDTDIENSQLSVVTSQIQGPNNGQLLSINNDGSFIYAPNAGFSGIDSFSYVVSDGANLSQRATVSINVADLISRPNTTPDSYIVLAGNQLSVSETLGVLRNDSDPDGAELAVQVVTSTTNGSLVLDADGSFVYTPNAGFIGTDTFNYVASNGTTLSSSTTVTITVSDGNTDPVASNDVYQVEEDTTLNVPGFIGLLSNDSDAENDDLVASLVSLPNNGIVNVNQDGSFVYVPDDDFNGVDQFTYRVSDGSRSDIGIANITVVNVDDAPIVGADAYDVEFNTTLVVSAANGVLSNDTDIDTPVFTAQIVIPPENGVLSLNQDGSFEYTPNDGFVGIDQFIYVIPDNPFSSIGQVQLDVQPEPTGPHVSIRLDATDLQGNALTQPIQVGDAFLLRLFATDTSPQPREGVFAAYADIEWPSSLATVSGAIDYSEDYPFGNRGDTSTPGLVDEAGAFHRDTSFSGDNELILEIPMTAAGPGTATFTTNPADILPFGNILLFDTFDEFVPLDLVDFGSTTVEIEGTPVPVANADNYVASNGQLVVNANTGVLANDLEVTGTSLTAQLVTSPANGTLQLNSNGSFTYVADFDFVGFETFTYRAVSNGTLSAPTTVTIEVGDRTPGSVSGVVYFDTNNNGQRDAGEHTFGGVDVSVTGTDQFGNAVSQTVTTATNGSYTLGNLPAGSYTVRQEQPSLVIDGVDSSGSGVSNLNDAFQVEIEAGENLSGFNFGERGLQPGYIGNVLFLGNRLDQGAGIAVNADGSTSWHCADGSWSNIRSLQATVSSGGRTINVTGVDNLGQIVSGSFATSSSNVQLLGNAADGYLVRLLGSSADFPMTPTGLSASAVDAAFV